MKDELNKIKEKEKNQEKENVQHTRLERLYFILHQVFIWGLHKHSTCLQNLLYMPLSRHQISHCGAPIDSGNGALAEWLSEAV